MIESLIYRNWWSQKIAEQLSLIEAVVALLKHKQVQLLNLKSAQNNWLFYKTLSAKKKNSLQDKV